jgi:hypothetical protein
MNPREDQYEAAIAEAEKLVEKAGRIPGVLAFHLTREEVPFVILQWAHRYEEERKQNVLRGCGHLHERAQVHTVFAVEPNHVNCPSCATTRGGQLLRNAMYGAHLPGECDFCHLHFPRSMLLPVFFNVAATVVKGFICTGCALGQPAAVRRVGS